MAPRNSYGNNGRVIRGINHVENRYKRISQERTVDHEIQNRPDHPMHCTKLTSPYFPSRFL